MLLSTGLSLTGVMFTPTLPKDVKLTPSSLIANCAVRAAAEGSSLELK